MINKDTRFNKLPETIKKRLITLYNKSKDCTEIKRLEIDTNIFSELSGKLSMVNTFMLQKNYRRLVDAAEYYKEKKDIKSKGDGENMKASVDNNTINDWVECYDGDRDVLGRMVECACLMSGKFLELKRRKKVN